MMVICLLERGYRSLDDLMNQSYNGWENKWSWLVHLHLSNEQTLFLEIAQLVASEPNDGPAGRLVEMWVRLSITNWMNRFLGATALTMHTSACWCGTCLVRRWQILNGMIWSYYSLVVR